MLQHDELDSLLNGIHWEQPLSPFDLNLPTDPDIITLSSSSPVSPVVQYLHAVQQQVAQFFVDLNTEKRERLKLCINIRQLEDELAQLRREVTEPSLISLPVPLTVDPPCSTAFQDNCALKDAQISKPSIRIALKRASSTTSKSRLPDQPRGPPPNQPSPGPSSSDLEAQIKQLEAVTKARNCRKTVISMYPSQFTFL